MLIRKLHRQHNSCVLILPKPVLAALDITYGDYVCLDICGTDHEVTLAKIQNRRPRDAESAKNQGERNKGRRS